jgi:hypothetical protein
MDRATNSLTNHKLQDALDQILKTAHQEHKLLLHQRFSFGRRGICRRVTVAIAG